MAQYEGLVTGKKEEGMMEVVIGPTSEGIPGASENINKQVCHCAADGSQVAIDALNQAGAQIGDWVLVRRESFPLVRNAIVLLGIPLGGILMGTVMAYFWTNGFSRLDLRGIFAGITTIFISLIAAILIFKRTYSPSLPIIVRVLKKTSEAGSPFQMPCAASQDSRPCSSCYLSC